MGLNFAYLVGTGRSVSLSNDDERLIDSSFLEEPPWLDKGGVGVPWLRLRGVANAPKSEFSREKNRTNSAGEYPKKLVEEDEHLPKLTRGIAFETAELDC